jgi:F420-dependent oxidoreductase-like protein
MLDTAQPLEALVEDTRSLAAAGFDAAWCSQIFAYDALTLLALLGREVPGIRLGTFVVPIYPRHPVMLAAQALTVQTATEGRLQLGIGLSHQVLIENVFGQSFDRPLRYMSEYLEILMPLLHGQRAGFQGEVLSGATLGPLEIPETSPPPVLLAALGSRMLELAGRKADGTATWMTGPATIADHIVPKIRASAEAAGRPAPRVAVGLPVCATSDVAAAREHAARRFALYGQLPSYRAMLDREQAAGPADVAIVGDEAEIERSVSRLADAGATEFVGAPYGSEDERSRTMACLSALARGSAHTSGQG